MCVLKSKFNALPNAFHADSPLRSCRIIFRLNVGWKGPFLCKFSNNVWKQKNIMVPPSVWNSCLLPVFKIFLSKSQKNALELLVDPCSTVSISIPRQQCSTCLSPPAASDRHFCAAIDLDTQNICDQNSLFRFVALYLESPWTYSSFCWCLRIILSVPSLQNLLNPAQTFSRFINPIFKLCKLLPLSCLFGN